MAPLVANNSFVFNKHRLAGHLHFFLAQAIEIREDAMAATTKQSRLAVVAMAAILMAQTAVAADQQVAQPAGETVQTPATTTVKREMVVSLEDRKLALIENGQVVKIYPVAVGKPSTPSPEGTFTIERRVENPTYHHDGKTIPPGPRNPVGTRWMGLSIQGYGIHGTNEPNSIGKAASHGCIRMAKADLEELYPQVAVGDTVQLVGHRNEETARLFGDVQNMAAQPVLAEKNTPTTQPAPATNGVAMPTSAATAAAIGLLAHGIEAATTAILTGAL
jgi:lipoprotein-anchoring transpeptidase ErfK/SrfK